MSFNMGPGYLPCNSSLPGLLVEDTGILGLESFAAFDVCICALTGDS